MLLSKRKINIIHQLFTEPYKPNIRNILSQKEQMAKKSIEIKNSINFPHTIETSSRKRQFGIKHPKKKESNITKSSIYKSDINYINNYSNSTISNEYNFYKTYYPLKREILIKNPEEIIQSGILKGSSIHKPNASVIFSYQDKNQNNILKPSKAKQIEYEESQKNEAIEKEIEGNNNYLQKVKTKYIKYEESPKKEEKEKISDVDSITEKKAIENDLEKTDNIGSIYTENKEKEEKEEKENKNEELSEGVKLDNVYNLEESINDNNDKNDNNDNNIDNDSITSNEDL